jgi:UDP-N-acetylmuramyl pentapeptide phosphotransferase/UDP-N-acetylglucosamine-1-phosphate transferase
MIKQMKKSLGILLAVCFLMSVTAAAVSAGPVVVKDKKTSVVILKDVKTKIFKHQHKLHSHHHGKFYRHHYKNKTMKGRKGKKMAFKTETVNKMPMKTGAGSNLPMNI